MLCASLLAGPAGAQAPPAVELDPARSVAELEAAMRFAADTGQPLAAIVRDFTEGALEPDFGAVARAAVPYQPIWGLVELENTAPGGDRPPDAWILASDIHGLVALDVFVLRPGMGAEQVLAHDIREPFDPTDYAVTRVSSAPVTLAAGERALLLVRMTHGAVHAADFSLETPADHQAAAFADGLTLAGFYAFLASCIAFFAVFNAALRDGLGAAYALLLTLGLTFIAYLDGVGFRLVYPERPGWHLPVGLALLLATTAWGFVAAAWSLRRFSTGGGGLRRPLLVLALGSAVCIPLIGLVRAEVLVPVSYLLLAVMLATQILVAFRWDALTGGRRAVFRVAALVAFLGLGVLIVVALARLGEVEIAMGWAIKGVYATIAILTMSGLSAGLIDMRREHATALEREMAALQKEAATTRDLLEAERNYSRARDLADRRRQQLATMAHDVRQPLASLRMTMEAMTRDAAPGVRARLGEAFDYMQDLTRGHLDGARAELAEEAAPEPGSEAGAAEMEPGREAEPEATEPYPLSLILRTVAEMFREEAVSKGLAFRVVPSSVPVTVPPLVLMRIVSNLVSNAVKYTDAGRVLMGVRRADGPAIVVVDTGRGMNADELAQFRAAWASGRDSDGHGLGLAICHELAVEHGLVLQVRSTPGRGTVFTLRVPRDAVL